MKGMTKYWWIVAISLVVLGAILCVVGFAAAGFDFGGLETVKYETNEYVIEKDFENLFVCAQTADVTFRPSGDEICRVVCYEQTRLQHEVSVEEGTLTVKYKNTRKWYEYLTFSFRTPTVTIYLPEKEYNNLDVQVSTGDIMIGKEFDFSNVKVTGSTGDVSCYASVSESLDVKISTGDILLEGATVENAKLSTSTGDIFMRSIHSLGEISISVSTGDLKMEDVWCGNLFSSGSTGSVNLTRTFVSGKIDLKRSTGNVKLDACDASEISIRTTTGNVSGSLWTEKDFHASATTGSVRVPDTRTGGRCEINTSTGNIQIDLCDH